VAARRISSVVVLRSTPAAMVSSCLSMDIVGVVLRKVGAAEARFAVCSSCQGSKLRVN
jgi:hypothetical protein